MTKTAFIGLGVMGYPMAGHKAAKGHDVTVFNRTTAKAEQWVGEHGGGFAATPREAVEGVDVVCACVGRPQTAKPNPPRFWLSHTVSSPK